MERATPRPDEHGHEDYQHPSLTCDLVMKGGITSGITYPKAVCEIARTYRVRNVGGTSAGAMAAAAAAAAEVGRSVPGAGYERLGRLPTRLSADAPAADGSVMFNLFQPTEGTRPLFRRLPRRSGARAAGSGRHGTSRGQSWPGRPSPRSPGRHWAWPRWSCRSWPSSVGMRRGSP